MLSPIKSPATFFAVLILATSCSTSAHSYNFKPFVKQQQPVPLTPLAASLLSATQIRDKWAVVIGISNFKDPKILPIKYGANSAIKLKQVFDDPAIGHFKSAHTLLLQQDDATRETVTDVLANGISRKALPQDMVIIYISTRWMPAKSGKDIIFCTNDTTIANPESTGIDLAGILKTIHKRTECKNIICILDLSPVVEGTLTDNLLTNAPSVKGQQSDIISRLQTLTNISIFSANNFSTSSAQTPFTESSYFARFLMEDLNGSGGGMPLDVFQPAIRTQVQQTVLTEQNLLQVPMFSSAPGALTNLALGAIVGKQKDPFALAGIKSTTRIGLDGGQLPITHPELLPGAGIGIPATKPTARQTFTRSADEINRSNGSSKASSAYTDTSGPSNSSGSSSHAGSLGPSNFLSSSAASAISNKTFSGPAAAGLPSLNGPAPSLQTLLQQSSPKTAVQVKGAPQTRAIAQSGTQGSAPAGTPKDEQVADVDLRPYIAIIKKAIQSKWQPPKGLEDHKIMTIFTVLKDGTIQQPEVSESSGIPSVDRAAMDALKAASPLPPLPAGSPTSIQLKYRFTWKVPVK
jgi:TonB family protein